MIVRIVPSNCASINFSIGGIIIILRLRSTALLPTSAKRLTSSRRWFTGDFGWGSRSLRCAPLYEWPRYRNAIICLADREIALFLPQFPSLHLARAASSPLHRRLSPFRSGRTHFRCPSTRRYRAPDRTDTLASLRCK